MPPAGCVNWTEYTEDYEAFCRAWREDMERYGDNHAMMAKPGAPDNTFPVSMVPWESFDGFRLDLYPTEPDPNLGVSPRQLMERTFRRCRRYAREFGAGAPSLLFTGGPGLGKTFLSACIARAVADNGFSVVYDTAGKLFSDFEAVKFGGNQQDLTRKYLQCDLLIIDDLGTEMTTQFTQSVLYRVLNDRLLENRPVIVSTNLSDQALRQRYSAPIASRLLGAFEVCLFLGQDIRQLHA